MSRALLVAMLVASACGGPEWYDTEVEIMRIVPVQHGPDGTVLDIDVQLEYPHCPGTQHELIRGAAEFAGCMQRYQPGARVAAHIEYYLTERNHHDWDIHRLGDCERLPDPDDEASFDTVEECEPTIVNGVEEGFLCNHIPHGELLRACPWFARH
jgi:hypothetical protein